MRIHEILDDTFTWRRDMTLEEEIATLGDDGIFEMANLPPRDTGINGVIFISTAMASHGPRVKFYVKTGRNQPSFSVSVTDEPEIVASSLPGKVVKEFGPKVIQWVKLNHEALLTFWNNGEEWMHDEVSTFLKTLQRLPN